MRAEESHANAGGGRGAPRHVGGLGTVATEDTRREKAKEVFVQFKKHYRGDGGSPGVCRGNGADTDWMEAPKRREIQGAWNRREE